ncbi:MAG TPA: PilZ domain-containing protein [Blastocatellia bacterium]|nr:PilZ domain-containing protein [Blastocatellia bacterium]
MSNTARAVPAGRPSQTKSAVKQQNMYQQSLERLIERVERSLSHYESLGVRPAATHEEIRLAYMHSLTLLYPPYAVAATVHPQMGPRIERVFSKLSWAFSVLASRSKRADYDRALVQNLAYIGEAERLKRTAPAPPAAPKVAPRVPAVPGKPVRRQAASSEGEGINVKSAPSQRVVYGESARTTLASNRRRCDRIRMLLPVRVSGHDRKTGKWHEMGQTVDVSRTGVTLQMRTLVRHGTVLYITLPLPTRMRAHGYSDPSYNVYTLVRRVQPAKGGLRTVALEFLGEHPPTAFFEKPWAIYKTAKWAGSERRRAKRKDQSEMVIVEYVTGSMKVLAREKARTENVSSSGARIFVNKPPEDFDLVRVTCSKLKFDSMATVSNRYFGIDGCERLCVQFINREWPV